MQFRLVLFLLSCAIFLFSPSSTSTNISTSISTSTNRVIILASDIPFDLATGNQLKAKNLIKNTFAQLNINYRIEYRPAKRIIKDTLSGAVDGFFPSIAKIGEIYPELFMVAEPFGKVELMAFVCGDKHRDVIDLSNYLNYRIGYIRGWEMLNQYVSQSKDSYATNNVTTLFNMLEAGNVDVVLYERQQGVATISQGNYRCIKPLTPALSVWPLYVYFGKEHQHLAEQFSQALIVAKQSLNK